MGKDGFVFSNETFRFFRELGRNNRKEWMDANRGRYRAHVVEPFRALLDRLTPAVLGLDRGFDVSGRTGRNFSRINRDIRFAKDKTPYRTQMYLMFTSKDFEDPSDGQLYVGLSPEAITAGFRLYAMSRDSRLARVGIPRATADMAWVKQQSRRLGRRFASYWYAKEKGDWTKHDGWPCASEDWKGMKGWIVRRKVKPVAATQRGFVVEMQRVFREVFPLYKRMCL